jgi:hypothetical protein
VKRLRRWFRFWLAWRLQRWAWWLYDSHDSWMIEWSESDSKGTHKYGNISKGRYRAAIAMARERKGKIIGHRAESIEA